MDETPKKTLRRETPALDQQPERGAVRHSAVDGEEQPAPKRSATLTGMQPPRLPPELGPTVPAPAVNPLKRTWRVPTPPSAIAQARRSDPPGDASAPASAADASSLEALRRRAEAAEAERDELARRERVRAETASPNTFPPKVEQRRPSPVPPSGNAKTDQAIGAGVRALLGKAAPYLLAAAGIGGGVTAVAKPTVDPAKADAVLASQEAMRADVALLREQVAGMLKREAARDQYVRCLEESLDEVGEQLLPAQDRLHNASPLRAYVKRCQRLRP